VTAVRGSNGAEEALERIARLYPLQDLVSRPLLLGMVLQTLDSLRPTERISRAEIFEKYLQRWLEQTHHQGQQEIFTDERKVALAEALAEQLWRSGQPSCSPEELKQSVRALLLCDLPEDLSAGAAFLEIFGGSFFVREPGDRYRFAHKSFQEFFLARSLVRTLPERPAEVLATPRPITPEVAGFLGELLRREGDPRRAVAIHAVQAWLSEGRRASAAGDEQVAATADAAANALRLLLSLQRWSPEEGTWLPERADLRRVQLPNDDLQGAALIAADLSDAELSGTNLSSANLRRAQLTRAHLVGARLDGAVLSEVRANEADFTLAEGTGCRLEGADLSGAVLRQSCWTDTQWKGARADGCDMTAWLLLGGQNAFAGHRRLAPSRPSTTVTIPQDHFLWVNAVAWEPGGSRSRLASAGDDGTVRLWDAASGRELAQLTGHAGRVWAVAWEPGGSRLASASGDGTVRLWDAASGRELARLIGHEGEVQAVAWEPGGTRLATASRDGTVRLWDAQAGRLLGTITMAGRNTLAYTPGGFCHFGEVSSRVGLAVSRPEQPGTVFYLPLGGLRQVLDRPDKARAALAGDLSGDDLRPELEQRGWADGTPWDGEVWRAPKVIHVSDTLVMGGQPTAAPTVTHAPDHFRPGPALTEFDTLPGREPVLQGLLALIESRSPAVLRGPRRSGKTSILHAVAHRLAPSRRVRHVTLEGQRLHTTDDLARCLEPELLQHPSPAAALAHRLDQEKRPVFLIDEVAHLGNIEHEAFAWLRAMGQKRASLVFVGSPWDWLRVVEHAIKGPGSSFGNDVTPVDLGPMEEKDAIDFLVTTAASEGVPVEADRTAAWILELCGPWPFYLQVMGHAVVQAVRSGKRRALVEREGLFDLYLSRLLEGRKEVFWGRWQELPPKVQKLLAEAGDGRLPSYHRLPSSLRQLLYLTGLCTAGTWLDDRPFFDWVRQNASTLRDSP
jgi:hypothetical protein